MSGLLRHVVSFGQALRAAGIGVTSGQLAHFVEALAHVGIDDRATVRDAGRATLTASRDESARFDDVFDRLWHAGRRPMGPGEPAPLPPPALPPVEAAIAARLGRPHDPAPQPVADRSATWSAEERLRRKRFDALTAEEQAALRVLFTAEAWPALVRRTRRFRAAPQGPSVDWRRTLRSAVAHHGELVLHRFRRPTPRPRPLVVLADISGSMERYARMMLSFLHAVAQASLRQPRARPLELFVFGTRLTRLTRAMRARRTEDALAEAAALAPDWSGGTRIGDALHAFNRRWSRRVLTRGPMLIIVSDGWDQGDPDRVAIELARLRRSCHRVLWLHPLAGGPGFEPRTRALVAALPHVDALLPAGTLRELADAREWLARET